MAGAPAGQSLLTTSSGSRPGPTGSSAGHSRAPTAPGRRASIMPSCAPGSARSCQGTPAAFKTVLADGIQGFQLDRAEGGARPATRHLGSTTPSTRCRPPAAPRQRSPPGKFSFLVSAISGCSEIPWASRPPSTISQQQRPARNSAHLISTQRPASERWSTYRRKNEEQSARLPMRVAPSTPPRISVGVAAMRRLCSRRSLASSFRPGHGSCRPGSRRRGRRAGTRAGAWSSPSTARDSRAGASRAPPPRWLTRPGSCADRAWGPPPAASAPEDRRRAGARRDPHPRCFAAGRAPAAATTRRCAGQHDGDRGGPSASSAEPAPDSPSHAPDARGHAEENGSYDDDDRQSLEHRLHQMCSVRRAIAFLRSEPAAWDRSRTSAVDR